MDLFVGTMQAASAPHQPLKPVLAAVAALLASAIFLFFSLKVGGQLRDELAYRAFAHSLKLSNYYASEQKLDKLLSSPRIFNWARSYSLSDGRIAWDEKKSTARELHNILRMLEYRDYHAAARRFNALRDGKLTNLMWSMPDKKNNTRLLADIQKGFRLCQQQARVLTSLESENSKQIAQLREVQEQQKLILQQVREKLATLFSLQTTATPTEHRSPHFESYSSGILKYLPTLPRLPDQIHSFVDLRKHLDQAGGEVIITGPEAPLVFKERLENLRRDAKSALRKISESTAKIARLEEELKRLRLAVIESGSPLELKLKLLLLSLCDPNSGPIISSISSLTSGISTINEQ